MKGKAKGSIWKFLASQSAVLLGCVMGNLQVILHWLQRLTFNLRAYPVMHPDFYLRCQVNQRLKMRPVMSEAEWHDRFCQSHPVLLEITNFVYRHLPQYSGLTFDRVLPSDRLEQDLYLTLVCWFDWHFRLYEDFWLAFQVDISDRLDWSALITVEDFVLFLNHQIQGASRSPAFSEKSGI